MGITLYGKENKFFIGGLGGIRAVMVALKRLFFRELTELKSILTTESCRGN
jgi:hypothetical protein